MKPSERIGQLVRPTLTEIEESIRSGAVGRHYPAALSDAEWENVKSNPAVQVLILDAMMTAVIHYLDEAAPTSQERPTVTTDPERLSVGYDKARIDFFNALHSSMGWTTLMSLEATTEAIRGRLHELEQRLVLISELTHDQPGDTHEKRSERLGQCAAVAFDGDAAQQATLKWAPIAHQLGEANRYVERLEAVVRAADDMRSWYDKQMGPEGPEDEYDRLRAGIQLSPSKG